MITKEELLQKGIPETVADEIIADISKDTDESSLQALEKALNDNSGDNPEDPSEENMFKAAGGGNKSGDDMNGENGGEDDYNESYMKKYMKRYMKENKKAVSKMVKEMGIMGGEMKKAIDEINLDGEGAVIEMEDLSPFLTAQQSFNEVLVKAISEICDKMDIVAAQNSKTYGLLEKSAKVQVDQANSLSDFLKTPLGRKGVTSSADMQKAFQNEAKDAMQVYQVLMKATKNGDRTAGQIIGIFESSGKRINALNPQQKQYVADLMKKEDK